MDVREKLSNEKRLIDADAFLEKMKRTSRYFDVVFDVDVVTIYVDSNYCPNCGAKMDGGDSDVRIAD